MFLADRNYSTEDIDFWEGFYPLECELPYHLKSYIGCLPCRFYRPGILVTHYEFTHADLKDTLDKFQCSTCESTHYTYDLLKLHEMTHFLAVESYIDDNASHVMEDKNKFRCEPKYWQTINLVRTNNWHNRRRGEPLFRDLEQEYGIQNFYERPYDSQRFRKFAE